jgi:hypothetical protein
MSAKLPDRRKVKSMPVDAVAATDRHEHARDYLSPAEMRNGPAARRRVVAFEDRVNITLCLPADPLWVKGQLDPVEAKLRFSK